VLLERRIMLQTLRTGCMLRRVGRGGKSLPHTRRGEPCEDRNHDDVPLPVNPMNSIKLVKNGNYDKSD
jgi:hypothetical protein